MYIPSFCWWKKQEATQPQWPHPVNVTDYLSDLCHSSLQAGGCGVHCSLARLAELGRGEEGQVMSLVDQLGYRTVLVNISPTFDSSKAFTVTSSFHEHQEPAVP